MTVIVETLDLTRQGTVRGQHARGFLTTYEELRKRDTGNGENTTVRQIAFATGADVLPGWGDHGPDGDTIPAEALVPRFRTAGA